MKPWAYQETLSNDALEILREHCIAYLAMEERTGKTLTAILVAEKSAAENILIITKKAPIKGWQETLDAFTHTKTYTVTNYHQAHKQANNDYDLIILDESHNYISSFPKPGKLHKELTPICLGKPILYLSATPHAQGPQMLYHQFKLSSWSPWKKHKNFYSWFKLYGKPYTLEISGIPINQYDRCDEELILGMVDHLFITKTRKELGFEHEPEDQLHYVTLGTDTKAVYNELVEHNIVELRAGTLVCDTTAKLRASLHMLEGGCAKIETDYIVLANEEKAQYILDTWGDDVQVVIMYNYKAELTKLKKIFKKATLLQATSYAEGIDLHAYKHLVVYSQDFSTARHTQRRARQANKKRSEPIKVHFLLVKGGISQQVYKTVSVNKKNFVDRIFQREKL